MISSWKSGAVFLGKGGNTPGLELFSVDSDETQRIIDLPFPHSAYAIDFESNNGLIAIGSKGGHIYILRYSEQNDEFHQTIQLFQGAPVLSVCWYNHENVIVSDIVGRCIVWCTKSNKPKKLLDVKNGNICALLYLKNKIIFGLSNLGTLHIWEPNTWQLVRTIDVPSPGSISALVKLVFWPAKNGIVYPSRKGKFTYLNIKNYQYKIIHAYENEAYAGTIWKDNLVTAGLFDSEIQVWHNSLKTPVSRFKTSAGILSMSTFDDQNLGLQSVDAEGSFNIIYIEQGNAEAIVVEGSKHYRIVKKLPSNFIEKIIDKQKIKKAQEISDKIQSENGRVPADQIQLYYDKLDSLGFPHITLLYKARQAESENNISKAIELRNAIIESLPQDNPKICPSLERYAILLEKAWLISEACQAYKQILSIDPSFDLGKRMQELQRYENYLKNNSTIISETDSNINEIIEAHTAVKQFFKGRYLVRKLEEIKCSGATINTELFKQKYEKIKHDYERGFLPEANLECVWMVSKKKIEKCDLITLTVNSAIAKKEIQLALKILSYDSETIIIPLVLFDWRYPKLHKTVNEENQEAAYQIEWLNNHALSAPFIVAQYRAFHMTLQRLITETRSMTGESLHAFRL